MVHYTQKRRAQTTVKYKEKYRHQVKQVSVVFNLSCDYIHYVPFTGGNVAVDSVCKLYKRKYIYISLVTKDGEKCICIQSEKGFSWCH